MSSKQLLRFKAICDFVNNLASCFEKDLKPLRLYKVLINKTPISNEKVIDKHVSIFTVFCVNNREQIHDMKTSLNVPKISYSNNVYIEMDKIFMLAEPDILKNTWKHLLTLSALMDSESNAKEVLREMKDNKPEDAPQSDDFIKNMISKIETVVKPETTPQEAISELMKSGAITDMMTSMQSGLSSGSLDFGKLMGSVQGLVATMGDADDPDTQQAMNMVNNMTTVMQNNNGTPDMGAMMGMVTQLMGGMGK